MEWNIILAILLPLVAIELGFRIYAVMDISKSGRSVNFISKRGWLFIVLVINFGWVFYLLLGRTDRDMHSW